MKTRILISISLLVVASCKVEDGVDGLNALLESINEPPGNNCATGGLKIINGIDKNSNSVLDLDEIVSTKFICNGSNGMSTLLTSVSEPIGANCPQGGIKIQIGKDINSDGQLSELEIEQTRFVCNGQNGINTLILLTTEPVGLNCSFGGTKVQTGKDFNSDGQLNNSEIEQTKYLCNGQDGGTNEVRFVLGSAHSNIVNPNSSIPKIIRSQLMLFNKGDYPGYDSIVYVVEDFFTDRIPDSQPIVGNGMIELYDITNNVVISNSKITSDNAARLISTNIYPSMPSERIDIGIKISSENDQFISRTGIVYLILIKRE